MYKRTVDLYEDDDFLLQATYEQDPAGGELVFGHSQFFTELTPNKVRKLRKVYSGIEKKLIDEGHSVLFMQLRNLHFVQLLGCPFDVLDADQNDMRLVACPLPLQSH